LNGSKPSNRLVTLGVPVILVIGVALVRAYLFGSGPPSRGAQPPVWLAPWYGFLGGIAASGMAITAPILAGALATCLGARTASSRNGNGPPLRSILVPAVTFGIGFAVAFSTPISGTPAAYAAFVSAGRRVVDIAGGILLVGLGAWALAAGRLAWRRRVAGRPRWPHGLSPTVAAAAGGAVMGLLLFHDLDPTYDSVFFSTGLAVAESHWPRAAYAFSLGLAIIYVLGIGWLGGWAKRGGGARRAVVVIQQVAAVAVMVLGVVFATGHDAWLLRVLEPGPPGWAMR
jgi:hypothetical protein